jgi:hypothetical protein
LLALQSLTETITDVSVTHRRQRTVRCSCGYWAVILTACVIGETTHMIEGRGQATQYYPEY